MFGRIFDLSDPIGVPLGEFSLDRVGESFGEHQVEVAGEGVEAGEFAFAGGSRQGDHRLRMGGLGLAEPEHRVVDGAILLGGRSLDVIDRIARARTR